MIKKTGIVTDIFTNKSKNQMQYSIKSGDFLYWHYSDMKTRKLDFIVDDAVEFEVTNDYSIHAMNIKRQSLCVL